MQIDADLAKLCGETDPAVEVESRRRFLSDAEQQAKAARVERAAAEKALRDATQTLQVTSSAKLKLVASLSAVVGRLGLDLLVEDDPSGLPGVAKQATEAAEQMMQRLLKQSEEVAARFESARQTLTTFRQRFELTEDQIVADALATVKHRIAKASSQILELRGWEERKREGMQAIADHQATRSLFDRLVVDLGDSRFPAYLLEAQRQILSSIASEKLKELTGHYSFDGEGTFQIVDDRSGATRSPATLSGGETFLASLSLALALAEAVSLEGGSLGCFFLDEGFGSLDAESLDLALEGIEALAVPGRLIGLISHVPGMSVRLDDLIVLERDESGSTHVVQHDGPIGYSIPSI
ncbi:MAG: hypothetical protein LC723_08275 [Actinobacteria bacterium]|nr:hypothetical protein [Actinomycetota bacterium]